MNIRLLFTLMIALLALTACNDKDEPDGSSNDSAAVYVSLQDNGQWYICSLDGEMIKHLYAVLAHKILLHHFCSCV